MRATYFIIVNAVVLFACISAQAQIHFTGTPSAHITDFTTNSSYRLNNAISSVAGTLVNDSVSLAGNATVYLDRTLPNQSAGYQSVFELYFFQNFSVGPLPVKAHSTLDENLEAILSLGTRTAPNMKFFTVESISVEIPMTGFTNDADVPDLGIRGIDNSESPMVGNNYAVFNTDKTSTDYILAPGFNYFMFYGLFAEIDNNGIESLNPPTAALTFEFGGTSRFINASIKGDVLPEPSSIVSAGTAIFLIIAGARTKCRRRRTGWREIQ